MTILVQKFLVRTGLNYLAGIQNNDSISFLDSRKSMRNDEGGSIFHEQIECFLDSSFRYRIQR